MCIFALPTKNVSNTKILVAPLADGLQLTVYENRALTSTRNAMILPVPWGPKGVFLIDGSKYLRIWEDCEFFFPVKDYSMNFGGGGGFGFGSGQQQTLEIHQVGAYKCSVAPTIADISRVNADVFTLPKDIETLLQEHYSEGFGFIICMFEGAVSGHPIAYISHMHRNGNLFIPTRHEHGDKVVQIASQRDYFFGTSIDNTNTHTGISCDGCGELAFQGTRWHCAHCPGIPGFDLCDSCHLTNNQHDPNHVFLELKRPLSRPVFHDEPILSGSLYENQVRERKTQAEYDHVIYIFNGTCLASPKSYSSAKTASVTPDRIHLNLLHPTMRVPELLGVQKVTLKGHFLNTDYWAAPFFQ